MITIRQEKAFKELVENGRTKGEAMVKACYSKNTSLAPTKMTNSKGWQELLEKYIPDDKLSKVLNDGLKAVTPKEKAPDYAVRHKYMETGFKLKDKFPTGKLEVGATDHLKDFLLKLNQVLDE